MVFKVIDDIVEGGEDFVDSVTGKTAADAAKDAGSAQVAATELAMEEARQQRIEETRRYEEMMNEYLRRQGLGEAQQMQQYGLLAPYMQAGQGALYNMMALSGIGDTLPTPVRTTQPVSGPVSLGSGGGGGGMLTTQPVGGPVQLMGIRDAIDRATGVPDAKVPGIVPGEGGFGKAPPGVDQSYTPNQLPGTELPAIDPAVNPYAGLSGADAQARAIEQISQSPMLAELMRQGEDAILQNAAATGGLRGGNVQGALAQFRPRMLQEEIDRQYSRLGGLSQIGQQSIVGAPATQMMGMPTLGRDATMSDLYQQMGAQQAGSILSGAQMQQQGLGNLLSLGGTILGGLF